MIRLIKNELFKIFHKLSTYIILAIALVFVVITNIIYFYYDDNNDVYYDEIDINEINSFINNYDPSTGSIDDYVYNLALLDSYNLSYDYDVNSWQYNAFMTYYLDLNIEYYRELHTENDEEKIAELNAQMLEMLQAIYNDDWKYFANIDAKAKEEEVKYYENMLNTDNLSNDDIIQYNKLLYVSREELELINYRLEEDVVYGDDYLNRAISDIEQELYSMAEYLYEDEIDPEYYESLVKDYHENKYILEEKIDTKSSNNLRGVIMNFFNEYAFLILLFVIMIAGGIVSDEFNKGTIKTLLIVPHERTSILWAKYLALMEGIP